MKKLLVVTCFLISVLGFAQEQDIITYPFYISNITIGGFNTIYSNLDSVNNITNNNIKRIDEIRQGQLIISTENMGRSFKNIKIDMRPSLNIEVQRIMFTGNFRNPRGPAVIRVK